MSIPNSLKKPGLAASAAVTSLSLTFGTSTNPCSIATGSVSKGSDGISAVCFILGVSNS